MILLQVYEFITQDGISNRLDWLRGQEDMLVLHDYVAQNLNRYNVPIHEDLYRIVSHHSIEHRWDTYRHWYEEGFRTEWLKAWFEVKHELDPNRTIKCLVAELLRDFIVGVAQEIDMATPILELITAQQKEQHRVNERHRQFSPGYLPPCPLSMEDQLLAV